MVAPQYVDQAFDGEGARIYGGRCNSKGTSMVYTASSLSLAAMEILVHLDSDEILNRYVCIPIEFPSKLSLLFNQQALPKNWRNRVAPLSTKRIGDQWVLKQQSVLLEVPSVLVSEESNFLINPAHPDFRQISIGQPKPFEFDPRLIKRSK